MALPAPIGPEDISHQVDLGYGRAPYGDGDTISATIHIDHKGKPTVFVSTYGKGKRESTVAFIGHSGTRALLAFLTGAKEKIEYILDHKPEVTVDSKPAIVPETEALTGPSDK